MRARRLAGLVGLLFLGGCSLVYPVDGYEVRSDGGALDAGGADDAGSDAGSSGDAAVDGGSPDAGGPDGGVGDAGPPDAGPPARCTDVAHGCDLVIGCSMPAAVDGAGSSVRVPFTVSNLGTLSGAGPFRVAVQMDHGGTFEEVGSEAFPGVLMPLGTQSGEVAFVVPTWVVPGENALVCTIDTDDEVPETDESNNEDDSSFVATGLPDLSLPFVSIASSPSDPFTTTFDVDNAGPTAALMVDWLISGGLDCCGGDTLATEEIPVVEAGETIRVTRTISSSSLSGGGAGDVLYRLDRFDTIAESDETNNDFRRAVTW